MEGTCGRGPDKALAKALKPRATLPKLFNLSETPHPGERANYNTCDAAPQVNVLTLVHFSTAPLRLPRVTGTVLCVYLVEFGYDS